MGLLYLYPLSLYGLIRVPQHYCVCSCKIVMLVLSIHYQLNISSLGSQSKQTLSTRVKNVYICVLYCMLLHFTPNSYTLGELLKEEGSRTKGLTSPVVQEKN